MLHPRSPRFVALAGVTLAVLATLLARPAAAQSAAGAPGPRGVYASLGGAVGVHRTSCPVCEVDGLLGGAGSLALGAALSSRVVLAGDATVGYFQERHVEDAYFQVGPTVILYPSTRRLWLKAGVGVTAIVIGSSDGGAVPGAAFTLGAGYDLPLGGALAIAPTITARYSTGRDAHTTTLLAGAALTLP